MKKIKSPINVLGSKESLASWIINFFPEDYQDMVYVEPYCGGGSVFLNKLPSKKEIISDYNSDFTQIFKSLRDEPCEFIGRLKRIKFSKRSFKRAKKKKEEGVEDYIEGAVVEIIIHKMSKDGKNFCDQNLPKCEEDWQLMIQHLELIKERVCNIHIFHAEALKVIQVWDNPETLIYVDPPYLSKDSKNEPSQNEMSIDDHIQLATLLNSCKSYIILSGHPSTLYNRLYKDWDCVKKDDKRSKEKRIECIWKNY